MAYLKLAQDLDMFGLSFFEISKMQGAAKSSSNSNSEQPSITAELWLGIDALGIRFYKKNKLRPEVFFSWSDIKSINFNDKKVRRKRKVFVEKKENSFLLPFQLVLNTNTEKNSTFAFCASRISVSREVKLSFSF